MIKIHIETNGEEILDEFDNKNCTLEETALVVYRLEQAKQRLLEKEFENKFKMEEYTE
jgi:hypothetical protein